MEKRKDIATNIIWHGAGRYISQFFGFFTAILIRRFLGPYLMGVWSLVQVVTNYAGASDLGLVNTLFYKFPLAKGKGDAKEVESVKNLVFSFVSFASIVSGIIIAIAALIIRKNISPELFIGLITASILVIVQRYFTYYILLLRADKNFKVVGLSIVFDAVVNLLLICFIVGWARLYGLYIVVIIMPLLNLLFVKAFTDYKVHVYFKIDKFITYLRFGLPLFFISLSDLLLKSIDKLMIAKMVGLEPLGMYTLVGMVGNYTTEASKNFNIVVTPYFLEDYGRTNDVRKVSRYLVLSAEMMSCIMAIVLGAIYIVMPVFTACILPRFSPAVTATRISLLALFFQVASPQSMNFLIAMNKQRRILAIMGLGVIVSATANYYLIGAGFGISGAAMAAAISSFTVFFAMTCSAVKMFSDLREGAYFFLRIMVPPLLICATVLCLGEFIRADDVHGTVLKLAIFILLSIPVMVHMNTRTNFIKTIVAIFTRKA